MMTVKDDSVSMKIDYDYPIPMRDGKILRAMVYRPDDDKKHPVLLSRTPYNKEVLCQNHIDPVVAMKSGYVVVNQDTRGRGSSEGEWDPFVNEFDDGYDTVEYLANAPWSDGNIGMYGVSYLGWTQLAAAATNPSHLKVITPLITGNIGANLPYRNGIFTLGLNLSWLLQVSIDRSIRSGGKYMDDILQGYDDIDNWFKSIPSKGKEMIKKLSPFYFEWMENSVEENVKKYDAAKRIENINIPVLLVAGFYDLFIENTENLFASITKNNKNFCKLLIGPWLHDIPWDSQVGDVNFGAKNNYATFGMQQILLKWFDRYLKSEENGLEKETSFQFFDLGINEWLNFDSLPDKTMKYYLSAKNSQDLSLTKSQEQGSKVDLYFDPEKPVPSLGGQPYYKAMLSGFEGHGAYDQREIEAREDVLSFTTEPFDKAIRILGNAVAIVYIEIPTKDIDLSLKLVNVYPDGRAINLVERVVRGSYINDGKIIPSKTNRFEIKLPMTCTTIRSGHCIRLDIACSNYPGYKVLDGKKTIYGLSTGKKYPSQLVLLLENG